MDNGKLLAQIRSNNAVINAKIATIQEALTKAPAKLRQNSESEKDRLRTENETLKSEIATLLTKLGHIEEAAGIKQISSGNGCAFNESNGHVRPVLVKQSSQSPKRERHVSFSEDPPSVTEVPANPPPASKKHNKKGKNKSGSPEPSAKTPTTTGGDGEAAIDVSRCDLRIGRIVTAKKHPDADSLYVEEVDLGEGRLRTVVSGLVKFIPLEEMQNRMAVLMCNLKPAKMRNVLSEAMVMCASTPEKVEILIPPAGSEPGDRVVCDGYQGTPDAQLNPKKKIWEQVAPDLKTNDNLEATYKGSLLTVPGKGTIKAASLANVQIK